MLIVFAAILATVAFIVLIRLLWLSGPPSKTGTVVTLAAAVLIIGLGILAATGRLHWLVAVAGAILPFLQRGIRYLRWIRRPSSARSDGWRETRGKAAGDGAMTTAQACAILGLGANPNKDEVNAAHRRLMQKLHPDRGGSTFLAQQLNEARRTLLQDL